MTFDDLLTRSERWHDVTRMEGYFNADKRLDALGVSIPPEMRVLELVVSWPRLAVEVLDEVLNVDGFSLTGEQSVLELLRRWWQANDLDTESSLVHTETMVQGRAFGIVGPGEEDMPRITVHRCVGMSVAYDHMGRVAEALRRFTVGEDVWTAHYQPYRTVYRVKSRAGWEVRDTVDTGIGRVPVVPFVNRARIGDRAGRSEMADVIPYTDAASRSLTNLQIALELMALPQRWLFGDGLQQMKDQHGKPVSEIESYLGRLLTGPAGASAGQFPGANLDQIINTVKLYAQMVSAMSGIPPSMLGISTDNPASAEAMRAAKERLITKAERKQAMFGDAWEDLMRIGLAMTDRDVEGVETLETSWRDPATPSVSARSAALLQAHAQGVVSAETARDGLQLTPEQKARENAVGESSQSLRRAVGLS